LKLLITNVIALVLVAPALVDEKNAPLEPEMIPVFILGTGDNLHDLLNISREDGMSLEIHNSSEASSLNLSRSRLVFLSSLDDRSILAINSTLNPHAQVYVSNLTTNLSLGEKDPLAAKYWIYGGKTNMRNLVSYLIARSQGKNLTADPPLPPAERGKIAFVTTTAKTFSLLGKAAEDPYISKQIAVSVYFVSPEAPESYSSLNFSDRDVIMMYMLGYPIQDGIREAVEEAKRRGSRVIAHQFEDPNGLGNVNTSEAQYANITKYWDYGGEENAKRLISFLGREFCNRTLVVLPPIPAPLYGLYHPDASRVFQNTSEYLEWYISSGRLNSSRPTVGIISYSIPGEYEAVAADALILSLEDRGANVVFGTYTYRDANSSTLFKIDNRSVVDSVIALTSFRLHYGDEELGIQYLSDLNATPLKAIASSSSPEEWANGTGLSPAEIPYLIALPELDGMTEFDLLSGKAKDPVSNAELDQPVEAQAAWIAERAISWARLHRMNNSLKKVAIIYYNHGGGKDNLGACYLDIVPSLRDLLLAMNQSGYRVAGEVPPERKLLDLMLLQGRNVGTWAPEELKRMVEEGDVILLPAEEYLSWFDDDRIMPPEARRRVVEKWGPPPGDIMVYRNESGSYLVIPALSFGNVIMIPQPSRGVLGNESLLYHDKEIPPHHQYIAFYLWLKRAFGADAIVHFGTHGTQEWLPGKETALSARSCWPALLVQDLPVIYPYIMDNVGEGTQAKRRGNAVIVDHLTPPLVSSGLYGNFSLLHEKIHLYEGSEEPLRSEIRRSINELCGDLNFSLDCNVSSKILEAMNATEFEGFLMQLHQHLHELDGELIPWGLHIIGQPPEDQELISMVRSMLGSRFVQDVSEIHSQKRPDAPENWTALDDLLTEVIFAGSNSSMAQIRVLGNVSPRVSDDLNLSMQYAQSLRECDVEIPRILDGLSGRYLPPRVGNDPIRNPDALPTGNNFYSFDARLVPSEEAWMAGRSQAEGLIREYQQAHNGSYPNKTAFVLWAVETMRHQGIVESEMLQLLGARPVWDSKGRISDVELIPSEELGRPRMDVLITASGLYRDTFPDKIQLLDKAVRLAAEANDSGLNYARENSEQICQWLLAQGYNQSEAERLSRARVFSEALGTYGTGLPDAVASSDTWENDSKLADLYIRRVGHLYGSDQWGTSAKGLLGQNLANVEAAVHSDSSNLIGTIDNDDFFQYLGGLSLAVRSVSGRDPDLYVANLRDRDHLKTESLKSFFNRELSARYLNPRWIEGMKEHGYAGAREMDKFLENLWGWEATVPDLVAESTWTEVHEVYIDDKYQLGLKEFFDQNNPWASQAMEGRMLETARKDRWHPAEEIKKELVERYQQSVEDYGVTCCHHTCGNLLLAEYMKGVLPAAAPQESSGSTSEGGDGSDGRGSYSSSINQSRPAGVGAAVDQLPSEPEPAHDQVKGFVMEEAEMEKSGPSISGAPIMGIALVLVVLFAIAFGGRRKV